MRFLTQTRYWLQDKMFPLLAKTLFGNVRVLSNSSTYGSSKLGLRTSKLVREGSKKPGGMREISSTSRKKETGAKSFLVGPLSSNRKNYGRLAGPGHAI